MSQTTDKFIKLMDNTDITGRYRTHLNTYRDGKDYAKLAYHNTAHVSQVLNLFEVLRKFSGQGFAKADLKRIELAIVFHDADHSGHPDSFVDDYGMRNIHRAQRHFYKWADSVGLHNNEQVIIGNYISMSEFPLSGDWFKHPESNRDLINLFRDADALWGMMPGNAEACMLGLWAERRNAGLEADEIDILKVLTNQVKFLGTYEPLTAAGRAFRNAMADKAAAAFAQVAMEYQRQLMAADMVTEMSDDEVLRLRDAIKQDLRPKMTTQESKAALDSSKQEMRENAEGIDCAATYPNTLKVSELLPGEQAQ